MKEKRITYILMCVLVWIWGLDYVFAKAALEILPPLSLLCIKYMIGLVVVFLMKLKMDRKTIIRVKDIPLFLFCAITGEILYYGCEYGAMSYIPVPLITVILSFVPIVSMIIEKIVFKRNATGKMVVGAIVCIAGIAVVIGSDSSIFAGNRLIGYLLAFGAVISWNIYNYVTELLSNNYKDITVAFNQILCTILLLTPYLINNMPPREDFTIDVVGGLLYLGITSAGIGFIIMVKSIKVLGPTISAMFSNFLPVTATLSGWIFLGEKIGAMQLVGGAIVVASSCIVIIEKGKLDDSRKSEHQQNRC